MSIIVPVAAVETQWPRLLADLSQQVLAGVEVLLAAPVPAPDGFSDIISSFGFETRWVTTRSGRAAQMNDAACDAVGRDFWFLHADSRIPDNWAAALNLARRREPLRLHYFGLRFFDGPRGLRLNEIGVAFRCRWLGLPFGDQGLCVDRETFFRLGGFDETAAYGEDHLFVWKARRHGVRMQKIPCRIGTSGRKYAEHGWFRTTIRHVGLTVRQAVPQFLSTLLGRDTL